MEKPTFSLRFVLFLAFFALCGCTAREAPRHLSEQGDGDLADHSREFRQELIKVTEGVYVAVGFGLANSVLLEGKDGVVIVDTMESAEAASKVKKEFQRVSSKPVKAIIYTHFHSDHTQGAAVMAGEDSPEIYCHALTLEHLGRIAGLTRETTYRRAMRQFGSLLPEGYLINAGIGPCLDFDEKKTIAFLPPTRTFSSDRMELDICGMRITLIHAPGETPDQTAVWIAEKRVLLPADNFYRAFPNLYAIRGTAYRDVMVWVRSLDMMRGLGAHYMVPHHTRPVYGKEVIRETLTNYRDAIQFVHDQTIRLMNKGLTAKEIVERVKLPPHLASQPYLKEHYGTVEWSVRAVFDGYLGWFGGNATDLFPLPISERARKLAALAGGEDRLFSQAEDALHRQEYQWALELSDHLLSLQPLEKRYALIRAEALKGLAQRSTAATARNYYLTQALEAEGSIAIPGLKIRQADLLRNIPLSTFFSGMAVRLDPEKSREKDIVAGFNFPDTKEAFTVHVRRGVAEISPVYPSNPAIAITVDSTIWKEVASGLRNPALALFKDMLTEGGVLEIARFLSLFSD